MREILFRGKDLQTGEWAFGDLIQFENGPVIRYGSGGEKTAFAVHPQTVGQYTGLNNQDGIKLFEGDIIQWNNKRAWIAYLPDRAAFAAMYHDLHNLIPPLDTVRYEIIGNIHDNPELMEE